MKLIIVRHGETYANLNKICQGQLNTQLTKKGIEQTKEIAQRLKNTKINTIYCSDLDRCVNTCKEIIKFHQEAEVIVTDLLREQNKGAAQGKKRSDRNKDLEKNNTPFHEWLPKGGETMGNVWDRITNFYKQIKQKHKDETILLVSHGGPISCLLAYLSGKELKDTYDYTPFKNTAISVVNIVDNKIEFEMLND